MSGNEGDPEARPDAATDTWSSLMARAQDGDRDSYRQLLRMIVPYVRSIAIRSLRDRDAAEDAVQDVLLTLHAMRQSYDPGRPFKPWLAGITRHRIADRMRGQGRIRAREISLAPEDVTLVSDSANSGMGDVSEQQDIEYDAARRGEALHAALAELPRGQRQAIVLLKLNEMSLREASAATGVTAGALKVATHRGIAKLRDLLGIQRAAP